MLHPAALTRQATNDQHALNGRPYADPFPKAVTRGEVYQFQRRPQSYLQRQLAKGSSGITLVKRVMELRRVTNYGDVAGHQQPGYSGPKVQTSNRSIALGRLPTP